MFPAAVSALLAMTDSDLPIAERYCRAFLNPAERAWATNELAMHGAAAIPVLQSILGGEAQNEFGVACRSLGMPVDCALVTIQRLGATARPLESLVRAEVAAGRPYAEDALRAIMAGAVPLG